MLPQERDEGDEGNEEESEDDEESLNYKLAQPNLFRLPFEDGEDRQEAHQPEGPQGENDPTQQP